MNVINKPIGPKTRAKTRDDLKAAGVSDFDGDKKKASGHKSERMVSVYDRKRIEVDATE